MKFRKRPVEIEAAQLTWERASVQAAFPDAPIVYHEDGTATIRTLEGVMRANLGDWIIRGVKGEFYPCKPDIFDATYETVKGD